MFSIQPVSLWQRSSSRKKSSRSFSCIRSVVRNSAKALLNYGFATYALLDAAQDVEIPEILVKLGAETTVQPVLQGDTRVLTQKGAAVEVTIDLPETLTAPVQAGQALGTLTATVNGEVVGQYPLVSQTEITRRNWLNLTLEMLKNLCMAG